MLYASNRNCARTRSPNRSLSLKFLNVEMSQLLRPGPRNTDLAALPSVPAAGNANAAAFTLVENVRSSFGSTGFPITFGRAASVGDPDQLFAFPELSERPTPCGAPLIMVTMPETCHPSSSAWLAHATPLTLGIRRLPLGSSQIQLPFRMCVRSNPAMP